MSTAAHDATRERSAAGGGGAPDGPSGPPDRVADRDPAPGPSLAVRAGVAALTALAGTAYCVEALRLGTGDAAQPGPGLFPLLTGVLIACSGIALTVQALRGRLVAADDAPAPPASIRTGGDGSAGDGDAGKDAGPHGDGPDTLGGSPPRVRLLAVVGALACYVVGVGWVGHLITATVVTTVVTRLLGGRAWWVCALVGLLAGLGTELVFGSVLGVPLPAGLYGINL